ncbi:MAG: GDP-perosamine synthase [Syntrophus sp. SKADARSKE-3]|nr:GDP-perosamine synthase [Syntrophus sp. SKADARSKE-3]
MIHHSRPTIDSADIDAVSAVMESGSLAQGEQVAHFEAEIANYVGIRSAVAVSSGTTALHLALAALQIHPGDEVIIPSFICTALLNAVRLVGATPILADCEETHFNLSITDVKKRLSSRTKALVVPHLFGQAADLKELIGIGLPVIEDCAQSLGSRYEERMTGSFGTLAVFSFYATKLLATGEGGMVASSDIGLMESIRDLRDYDEKDDDRLRFNCKMTDMQAALGRSQLRRYSLFLKKRQAIAHRYDEAFKMMGLDVPVTMKDRDHIYYRYVIRHKYAESLIRTMNNLGISCRRPIYKPLHYYLRLNGFPASESLWQQTLSLPIYPSLPEEEVEQIISSLVMLIEKGI